MVTCTFYSVHTIHYKKEFLTWHTCHLQNYANKNNNFFADEFWRQFAEIFSFGQPNAIVLSTDQPCFVDIVVSIENQGANRASSHNHLRNIKWTEGRTSITLARPEFSK